MCDVIAYLLMLFADWYIADASANQPPDYVTLEKMRKGTI
jgi:hypothetical protein